MLAKRLVIVLFLLVPFFSASAFAQRADAAFVVGGSFVSDSTATAG